MQSSNVTDELLKDYYKKQARTVDPVNHADLYTECWLKIREKELNGTLPKINNIGGFFYLVLKNQRLSNLIKKECEFNSDGISEYQKALDNYIARDTPDEIDLFIKNIVILSIRCKNITDAIKMTDLSRMTFYHFLEIGKQRIRDEYIRMVNSDSGNPSDLV